MKKVLVILLLSLSLLFAPSVLAQNNKINCVANQSLPDSSCTPGLVLTTSTEIICVPGYSKKVRDVSKKTKQQVYANYGLDYTKRAEYQVDHLIPLMLGGSNDISNLWPQKYDQEYGVAAKVKFEDYLYQAVCQKFMSIEEAQREISTDWVGYYKFKLELMGENFRPLAGLTKIVDVNNRAEILPQIKNPRCGDCISDIVGCELDPDGCLWKSSKVVPLNTINVNNSNPAPSNWFKKYSSLSLMPWFSLWNLFLGLYK